MRAVLALFAALAMLGMICWVVGGGDGASSRSSSDAVVLNKDAVSDGQLEARVQVGPSEATQAASAPSVQRMPGSASGPWTYPRGLGSLVDEALSGVANVDLLDLVGAVRECEFASANLLATERAIANTGDLDLKTAHAEKYKALQRKVSQCQTLAAEPVQVQARLLRMAVEREIIGAAALLLNIEPELTASVVSMLARDALAGDFVSIAQIVSRRPADTGVSSEVHQALVVALNGARQEPSVALEAQQYMDMAASWSNARQVVGKYSESPFISSATRPVSAAVNERSKLVLAEIVKRHGGRA